ncbi:hypothetical protein VST7929_02769 [Vibrio stylophorae]|uniref:Uncharacterized protein n=1 Tax=Vibrio stylophorae TaxID=659351 RepID=A0ABN8DZI7_9VIBR|nr:hypothetical protein [Vibrio stylophorae]CAH0535108.1 hypothetical protein VST7929_02769 [Vibrio stylophorae]
MTTATTDMAMDTICGGWTRYRALNDKDMRVFNAAMDGYVGVAYQPREVATQVVSGINYRYKCDATLPGPTVMQWEAIVEIYEPLDGQPCVMSIHKI